MIQPITLPSLGHFQNGNGWLGSAGLMRFQIEPPAEAQMTAVLWQGPFSRPYAQELRRQTFPVSGEGLAELLSYLNAEAAAVNAAPPFTGEETAAFYQAKKAEERTQKSE